jgi:hypothetical protein
MNLLRYTSAALVVFVAIPLARVDAGSEKVAFPANFKSGVLLVARRCNHRALCRQPSPHFGAGGYARNVGQY